MALPAPLVLIAGAATRGFAESAFRAGYHVLAIDGFGDRDQERIASVTALRNETGLRYSARSAARVSRGLDCWSVAYVSNFENHPAAVRTLARGRRLLGNPPAVLRRVRDPFLLQAALRRRGFPTPRSQASTASLPDRGSWLLKPRASGGGRGVRPWRAGRRVGPARYLQEWIRGIPGSLSFVADGRAALPFAFSRQIVGDAHFGARGFRYAGSILAAPGDQQFPEAEKLYARACALAQALVDAFGLRGVNGMDFVARDGIPYPLEVNPRYSASMELAERAFGFSVFGAHAGAFADALPDFDYLQAGRGAGAFGKAVLYARTEIVVGDTGEWLEDDGIRDVPHSGERIPGGSPICTVFATGRNSAACYQALARRAARLYTEVETGWGRVA